MLHLGKAKQMQKKNKKKTNKRVWERKKKNGFDLLFVFKF